MINNYFYIINFWIQIFFDERNLIKANKNTIIKNKQTYYTRFSRSIFILINEIKKDGNYIIKILIKK
jgi:hypothetical protein